LERQKDMSESFSIIFMGTPEFAVSILDTLYKNNIEIKAVVTAPDKPAGRGRKINESAVKKFAVDHNMKILQPTNLMDETFLDELQNLNADLFVVVAFRMLPEQVWGMPPMGTINLHASLLPDYRGAAPINRAIMNGDTKTGVTTFFIEKEIDTGKIIEQEAINIDPDENVGSLYERLMKLGAEVTLRTVNKIKEGDVEGINQDSVINTPLRPAPKIFKEDCKVNFHLTAKQVHDHIRGLSPYPGAWAQLKDKESGSIKTFKLFESKMTDISSEWNAEVLIKEKQIFIPCSDYYLEILQIQAEGKRRMNALDFLLGNDINGFKAL
jgi:methionyl-tRNA formyltransferase